MAKTVCQHEVVVAAGANSGRSAGVAAVGTALAESVGVQVTELPAADAGRGVGGQAFSTTLETHCTVGEARLLHKAQEALVGVATARPGDVALKAILRTGLAGARKQVPTLHSSEARLAGQGV